MGELAFRLLLAMKMTRHILYLLVVLSKVSNSTSAQEECTITPLNPTNALTATGGTLASGTENVMIQCSCPINSDEVVRWYDPDGNQLVNNASPNFNPDAPHFTRVEPPDDNMNVILVIPIFNDTYDGTYYCGIRVNRTMFRAPNARVVLTIYVAPPGTVDVTPNHITVDHMTDNVTFTCHSMDGLNLNYSWLINGSSDALNNSDIVVNGSELTVNNVTYLLGGVYTCVVTNMAGQSNDSSNLFVNPFIVTNPVSQLIINGSTVSFSCTAVAFPAPSYSWSTPITNSNFSTSTISFIVDYSYFGNYTCKTHSNGAFAISQPALLTVSPQGSVKVSPVKITTTVNSTVNVTCSGEGGPNNMFEWRKQGTVVSNNAVLEFPVVTGTDGAVYECTVSNAAGDETRNITLTVAPYNVTITKHIVNNGNVTYTCYADGGPGNSYHWLRLRDNEVVSMTQELVLNNVDQMDRGDYQCTITNIAGNITSMTTLNRCPDKPINVQIFNVNSRNLTINWTEPHNNNDPITGYNISYQNPDCLVMANSVPQNVTVDSTEEQVMITGLHPGEVYTFTVIAINNICPSQPSFPVSMSTVEEVPEVAPTIVSTIPAQRSINVSWMLLDCQYRRGSITMYEVCYTSSYFVNNRMSNTLNGDVTSLQLNGLEEFVNFTIEVRAYTAVGPGPYSSPIEIMTLQDTPSVPVQNVTISNVTDGDSIAVFIEWYPPADPIGVILWYRVQFMQVVDPLDDGNGDNGDSSDRRKRNIPLNVTVMNAFVNITGSNGVSSNITLSGLVAYRMYNHSIFAANAVGEGPPYDGSFLTREDTPLAPINLTINIPGIHNPTTLLVDWERPSCNRGILSGYELCYVKISIGNCVNNGKRINITDPNQLSYTIIDLSISTTYVVELRGRTGAGLGESANATGTTEQADIVNIVQNKSGYDVVNNSIVNAFNNPERSIVLDCVTVRGHENAVWIVQSSSDNFDHTFTNHSVYLSTITITDPGMNISVSLKCMSDTSKEYRIVTVTTENPYSRLLSNVSVESLVGTKPILMYVIAVDADGTREEQKNLTSIASFKFVNSDGEGFNYSSRFTEFVETSFQYYSYVLPLLEEDAEGNYILTLVNSEGKETSNTVSIMVRNTEDLKVEATYYGITILQGDNVTLSCRPSQSYIALQWSYNGSDISSSLQYQFNPPLLNHDLTIFNANVTDSGSYVCAIKLLNIQETIVLTVVATCLQDFAGGLLWPTSARNRVVTQRCSILHPSFRSRVAISRKCNNDGSWGPVDYSNCTALESTIPTLLISFKEIAPHDDAQHVVDNITHQIISSSNVTFVSNDSVLYDLQQTGSTGILIRLTSNELTENSTLPQLSSFNIPDHILLYDNQTILFIPGLKCSCKLTDESIRTMCIGPSIPPCNCNQTSCECNSPFVGNGNICGLDTDGDGCPDVDLQCSQEICTKDLCVNGYTEKCNSDDTVCQPIRMPIENTSICLQENDIYWNVLWPLATRGKVVKQKCPGGAESLGLASRTCDGDPAVWDAPNVEECSTVEITRIKEEISNLMDILTAFQNTNNSDRTIIIEPEMFQFIIDQLASITGNMDRAILPNDLRGIIMATGTILSIIRSDAVTMTEGKLQNLLKIFDNIYNLRNQVAYNILDTTKAQENRSIGSVALDNVEILADVIKNTLKVNGESPASVSYFGEFISIEAQLLLQADKAKGINFPKNKINFSVQSEISNSIIRQYPGPVAHAFLANSFLPSDFDGPGEYDHSFPVLAVQISATERVELPENSNVLLKFNIPEDLENRENTMICVFWQPERNSWSDEGVLTSKVNNTVECRTTHLTSFSVLVDTQGNTDSTAAETTLSIITYIGCGISILSLLLTMLVILYWRKSLYKGVPNFIHFNLALSLFIGIIVFVSGIETAKDNEAGCTAVAVMLHYFFLAAFSWMLCEGLYLFIFINLVFYNGILIKWYFYLGLGWGLPVPVVAIAAGIANEHYGSERGCWLSEAEGTIWAFVAPMLLIILVNSIFLAISLRVAYRSKRRDVSTKLSRVDAVKSICISAFSLMPILGSTWIIGIFAVNEHTEFFAWIFTILNSLQGFLIFFFYVLKQEKVRKKVKTSNFVRRFSETFLTTLSRQSKTLSANNEVNLDTSRYRSTRNESIALTSVTFDVVKSVKSPTEEATFTIEPSSVLEKNCFLDSYAANGEPENKSSHTDANGTEILNTTTVICNKDDNTDSSSTD